MGFIMLGGLPGSLPGKHCLSNSLTSCSHCLIFSMDCLYGVGIGGRKGGRGPWPPLNFKALCRISIFAIE